MFKFKNRQLDFNEIENKFQKQLNETPLEKKDVLALIIAGFIIAIPVMLIVSAIVLLSFWLVAGR